MGRKQQFYGLRDRNRQEKKTENMLKGNILDEERFQKRDERTETEAKPRRCRLVTRMLSAKRIVVSRGGDKKKRPQPPPMRRVGLWKNQGNDKNGGSFGGRETLTDENLRRSGRLGYQINSRGH